MVDRQEVEALLAYVEMRMASDKVELPPSVSDSTLAALCRAWLAMDGSIEGRVCSVSYRYNHTALAEVEYMPAAGMTMPMHRVRIVKEVG